MRTKKKAENSLSVTNEVDGKLFPVASATDLLSAYPNQNTGGSSEPVYNSEAEKNLSDAAAAYMSALSAETPTYNYTPSSFSYTPYQQGQYVSSYDDLISAAQSKLANFSYDPESDTSYQAYAGQYRKAGRDAYDDTLAKIAARTGGVASSYAEAAAQQQYGNYMSALAAKIPELAEIAYNRQRNELSDLLSLDSRDYERWADQESARADAYNTGLNIALKNWEAQNSAAQTNAQNKYETALAKYNADIENAANAYDTALSDYENDQKYLNVAPTTTQQMVAQINDLQKQGYTTEQIYNLVLDKITSGELDVSDMNMTTVAEKTGIPLYPTTEETRRQNYDRRSLAAKKHIDEAVGDWFSKTKYK